MKKRTIKTALKKIAATVLAAATVAVMAGDRKSVV